MNMTVSSRYAIEARPDAERVAAKVEPSSWVRRHLQPHLAPPLRVLEVGCGSGTIAAEVARRFPDHEVVALDASEARVVAARRNLRRSPNARAITGSANALPFEDESFDLVYCRFHLGQLPDKQAAVDELARVCRPRGRVLLQELDGQILDNHPPDPDLQLDLTRALELLATTGFDPDVGRKLPGLLVRAGLTVGGFEIEPYHVISGAVGREDRAAWQLKLAIAASTLTRLGFDGADELADRFLRYLDREDTVTLSRVVTAWAVKGAGRVGLSDYEREEE
jgi:SAM-dependent methyltransferase